MPWNWQLEDWPVFSYDIESIDSLERQFLHCSGELQGSMHHLDDLDTLRVELLSSEALRSSEIEGEQVDRDSIQASIRYNLGLSEVDGKRVPPKESGIAKMITQVYGTWAQPLTHTMLFDWHRLVMRGRDDLDSIGEYRSGGDPTQVVSGADYNPKGHFEAPPCAQVHQEMERFVDWYNNSADLPTLVRAGLAHLHFIAIHPFADGNGRIARALS